MNMMACLLIPYNIVANKKLLKTVWLDCKANFKTLTQRLTKMLTSDRTSFHEPELVCKLTKNLILWPYQERQAWPTKPDDWSIRPSVTRKGKPDPQPEDWSIRPSVTLPGKANPTHNRMTGLSDPLLPYQERQTGPTTGWLVYQTLHGVRNKGITLVMILSQEWFFLPILPVPERNSCKYQQS